MKLGILVSHPIQYYAYWFQHLAERFDIEVFYMHRQDAQAQAAAGFGVEFEWDLPLLEGYPHRWLENVAREPSVSTFAGCDTPEIYDIVERGRYDAFLIFGWNRKSALQAVRACKRSGVPVFMRGDSQLETQRSPLLTAVKYPAYRAGLPRIDAHLYVGTRNRAYLEHYGVSEERLFHAPHFVNNDFFAREADAARRDGRARALRAEHGIPEDAFVALFVGKFIDKKRPGDLVRAIDRIAPAGGDRVAHARSDRPVDGVRDRNGGSRPIHALFVGDGPLRGMLEAEADPERVHFAGFRNQTELPACYAAADALVLPSDGRETWGLVANEAMACGLPVIVSEAAGCAPDLVREGETGFTVPLGDIEALAARLRDTAGLLTGVDARGVETVRRCVADAIERHSVEKATEGLERAMYARTRAAAA